MTRAAERPPARRRRAQRGSGEQLRAEIVAATKRLLADGSPSAEVSIRKVADAVGVTSPSIYLHFADKDALLEAVVVDVFAELDAAMVAAGEGVSDPLQRLRAYGQAYVRFAVTHPEHYRLATMERCVEPVDGEQSELDRMLDDSAFQHLAEVVQDCVAAGIFSAEDPLGTTFDLWAAAHGIAALMIAKPYLPWRDREAAADRVLVAAALGHAVIDRVGGVPASCDPGTLLADWPLPGGAGGAGAAG